jgi:hypothetical protein
MTRPIRLFLLLTAMTLTPPGVLCSQSRTLDSVSLVRAQVYLDSLWAVYAAAQAGAESANPRMVHLLNEWAERRSSAQDTLTRAVQVCIDVYSDLFRSRYFSNVRTEEKHGLVATVRTPYLLIPDSVRYLVIDDSTTWAMLSGRAGDRKARNAILYYPTESRTFVPTLEMPATIIHTEHALFEALNCFINGEKTAQESSSERTPTKGRFDWLSEYFPICFSHFGNYYPVYASPQIGIVALNHDLTEAVVTFSPWCYTGEKRHCRKVDGVWKSIESYDHYDI